MSETLREAAIRAVWALEDREVEPTVEQYVDTVLAATAPTPDEREVIATRILNTVDPLLPGHEARMACVRIVRGEDASPTPDEVGQAEGLSEAEEQELRTALRAWLPVSYEGAIKYLAPAVERILAAHTKASR